MLERTVWFLRVALRDTKALEALPKHARAADVRSASRVKRVEAGVGEPVVGAVAAAVAAREARRGDPLDCGLGDPTRGDAGGWEKLASSSPEFRDPLLAVCELVCDAFKRGDDGACDPVLELWDAVREERGDAATWPRAAVWPPVKTEGEPERDVSWVLGFKARSCWAAEVKKVDEE